MRFAIFLAAAVALAQDVAPEKLIADGHWKKARAVVTSRLAAAPDDPELSFFLSQIRNAFGDRAAPLALAEKAAELAPRVARYHRQLAEVQGVMAQPASAFQQLFLARKFRKEIDAALAIDARDTQALRDLIEYYLLAPGILGGDVKRAETIALRIASIDAVEGLLAQARIASYLRKAELAEQLTGKAAQAARSCYKVAISLAQFHFWVEHRLLA
jgi:hypothetical protein